eukprot:COSAG02_NODE_25117_length_668_cov_2.010545_1_plen_106_part_10
MCKTVGIWQESQALDVRPRERRLCGKVPHDVVAETLCARPSMSGSIVAMAGASSRALASHKPRTTTSSCFHSLLLNYIKNLRHEMANSMIFVLVIVSRYRGILVQW